MDENERRIRDLSGRVQALGSLVESLLLAETVRHAQPFDYLYIAEREALSAIQFQERPLTAEADYEVGARTDALRAAFATVRERVEDILRGHPTSAGG